MNLMTIPAAEVERDLGQQIEVDEAVMSRTFGYSPRSLKRRKGRWLSGPLCVCCRVTDGGADPQRFSTRLR